MPHLCYQISSIFEGKITGILADVLDNFGQTESRLMVQFGKGKLIPGSQYSPLDLHHNNRPLAFEILNIADPRVSPHIRQ